MATISCGCVHKNLLQSLCRMHTSSIINRLTWLGITELSVIHTGGTSKTLYILAVTATHTSKHQNQEGAPPQDVHPLKQADSFSGATFENWIFVAKQCWNTSTHAGLISLCCISSRMTSSLSFLLLSGVFISPVHPSFWEQWCCHAESVPEHLAHSSGISCHH